MEPLFQQLGISVLLGLLVGLQREHAASGMAGMRTFPLIAMLGSVAAVLADHFSESWILAAGLLAIVAVTAIGHRLQPRSVGPTSDQPGITTDVAMLLMYAVGALVVIGPMPVAIAIGGGVAVLLQFKPELHNIARKLGDEDLRAIMQFVLITCIVLPVLPNQNYGPSSLFGPDAAVTLPDSFDVFNPFETWLMVVLIVGLSLGGYIIYKFFGRDAGVLLGGILGGTISSTATTVSYARSARGDVAAAHMASVVIMIASTIMYLRVLLAVTVVSSQDLRFLKTLLTPMFALMLLTLLPAMVMWFRVRQEPSQMPKQQNPTQLKSAVIFGAMYALVLLALAVARHYWNGQGLYAVAFFSGLTEMDAVTLSTARLALTDPLVASDGWRMIVIAAMANSVSKTVIAGLLGGWGLFARIVVLFTVPMLGGAALLALW
jgi:uncharacterized membrane protein (DUF4010 family)